MIIQESYFALTSPHSTQNSLHSKSFINFFGSLFAERILLDYIQTRTYSGLKNDVSYSRDHSASPSSPQASFCLIRLQTKNSIFLRMFSCLKDKREVFPSSPPAPLFAEPPKSERKQPLQRIYNNDQPIIRNEYLDPRDQRIFIPFSAERCTQIVTLEESTMTEVSEWLMKANYVITSRAFRHLSEGRLTEIESKTYTSRNMLLNVKELMGALGGLREELREELMVRVNAVETEILSELMLKYPQSSNRGASKRIRSLVRKIDNRDNPDYDFLLKNDFTFPFRPDGHYASDLMRALNKMIAFANELYQPDRGANTDQDSYFQIWAELIEFIVANDVKANPQAFFRGFDFFYTYVDPEEEEKFAKDGLEQKLEEASRSRLKINHKIPLEANLFSEEEIESGECKIRNASVLRVIAKWTYQLLQKLKNPKETFLHRAEKFKLLSNKLYSLENNQKLAIYEAALKEGQRIDDYIARLRREYILLQTVFAAERTRHRVGTEDNDLQVYALRVREVYSQCLFKLLCRLVDALKRVPRSAAEIYLERYQTELPEDELRFNYEVLRQVDLVSFKVGDLIRGRYACSESEFLRIYKNLIEVSEQRPEALRIVRIKNRLDHKENDILLNLFFMNKVQCELQLSFDRADEDTARKAKLYSSYNHFLYELRRSLMGPIGEYACILGEHDPVVSQYVILDKNTLREKTLLSEPERIQDPATEKRKSNNDLFLPDKLSENTIALPTKSLREITPALRQIREILFLCEHCGELKKPPNFLLAMRRKERQDSEDEEVQPAIRECRECFLRKLQLSLGEGRVGVLLGIILGQQCQENELLFRHLQPWEPGQIPMQFRAEELEQYLPREGFVLSKESRVIAFHYFRTFSDEDYTYLVSKTNSQCLTIARLNRILNEDQILQELAAFTRKFFLFRFDKQVSIQDGCSFGFGRQGEVDAAVCGGDCCRAPVVLGAGVQFRQFNEAVNKVFIRRMLEEFMNVMYLSKRHIGSMINEIVLEDKKYDRSCKNVTIIEAEDSHLTDIRFASKMLNLSDLYIRYNGQLASLNGIQQCRNLKILYCNQCRISSLLQLRALTALEELSINQNKVTSLEGLENCVNLKDFSCFWNQISTLEPIKNCKNLEKLDIGQNSIASLTPLAPLIRLKNLATSKNSLTTLEGVQTLSNLEVIDFSHTAIIEMGLLQQCPKIQRIFCSNTLITSLAAITAPNLIQLDCGECTRLLEFDLALPACAALEELTADKCANLRRLKHIERCVRLRELYLQENSSLYPEEFVLLSKCQKLQELNVSGNKSLGSLYFLQRLGRLTNLICCKCDQLTNLHFSSIKKCPSIEILNLSYNRSLTNPDFLKGCINLNHLNLSATGVRKFDKAFLKLAQLRHLQLKDMRDLEIANFDFLRDSPEMEKIVIDEISDIQSLKGLERMEKLKEVLIGRILKPDEARMVKLQKQLQKMPIKVQRSVRLLYDPI